MHPKEKRGFIRALLCDGNKEQPEEPDQQWDHGERKPFERHAKLRCLIGGCFLLVLFFCALYDLVTTNYLPLFVSICVLFLGGRALDASFRFLETHSSP